MRAWWQRTRTDTRVHGATARDNALLEAFLAAAPALLTAALIVAYFLFGSTAWSGLA